MNDKPGWELQYQLDTLRADLAKAQAETEDAYRARDRHIDLASAARLECAKAQARVAELESGCWCASLKVDGAEALAAVRLAQGVCDELLTSGASIYGDGRLSDEMRAQVIAASNAIGKAFGSRT